MLPTDLFSLVPGTLPGGNDYCWLGWQRYYVDMFTRAQIVQRNDVGTTFWNVSASTPSSDKRIYPWLNLNNGKVYFWSFTYGMWISPIPFSFGQFWIGSPESALWSMDGGTGEDPRQTLPDGSSNPAFFNPTPVQGAVWQVEHRLDGRFPLGAGQIPYVDPANPLVKFTTAPGDTVDSAGVSGEYAHILSQQEGGLGAHTHKFGLTNPGNDDAYFSRTGTSPVPSFSGYYITGSNGNIINTQTTADLETLPPLDAAGAVPDTAAFNKMPPFLSLYWITRTARAWYVVAG